MGDFLNTVFAALAVTLAIFLAQRSLPAARWSRQLAVDAATLSMLPEGVEKTDFERQVRRQVARLVLYRSKMTGLNRWIVVFTWGMIALGVAALPLIWASTTDDRSFDAFVSAILAAGWPGFLVAFSGLAYAVFQSAGGLLVPRLDKVQVIGDATRTRANATRRYSRRGRVRGV